MSGYGTTLVAQSDIGHAHSAAAQAGLGGSESDRRDGGLLVAAPPALRQTTMACETSRKWTKFGSNLSTNAVE
jgi:hypothetical protein